MRITLRQFAESRAAQAVGICNNNYLAAASYANEAIERLINAFSETGPYGAWDKVVFTVATTSPYITLPAAYSRAVNLDVCRQPVRIQNGFYELLAEGIGLQTLCDGFNGCGTRQVFDRGNVPTMADLPANSLIRIYPTNMADIGKRLIFTGALDANSVGIYSQDGLASIDGFPLVLQSPFTTTAFVVSNFSGVEKDLTRGDVVLKAVDATTGVETLLSRYTPTETNPSYRRYYLHALPCGCCPCPSTPGNVQITAMLKNQFVPVSQPTDQLLISCIPALKEECLAIRYSEQDTSASQQFALLKHKEAVRLLNQQLASELGTDTLAINVKPSGVIGLRRQLVGSML